MLNEKGQTLMELIVVTAVSLIIIGALVFATISSLRNAQYSKNQSQATKLAQQGLERVRTGRDRNQCIISLDNSVNSWNGGSSNAECPGDGALWDYSISGAGNSFCDDTTTPDDTTTFKDCYFTIGVNGSLKKIASTDKFPEDEAEGIPPSSPIFKRAAVISDEATTGIQKTVTVMVRWTDFSGSHESKLTTILRKI